MGDVSLIGIGVFLTYMVVMLLVGWVSSKYQKTSSDFWVAGRSFGTVVMTLALMASIMHGGSIISGAAFAARFGGPAILPFISFTLGFLVILVVFAKKLRNMEGVTLPDFMGRRFKSTFLQGFCATVIAVSSILYLIAQTRGMGLVLETLLGIPLEVALVVGTFIFVAYVVMGGLMAVVWTNIFQFIFMWIGLIVLMPTLFEATNGWSNIFEVVDKIAPGWTSVTGTTWTTTYMLSWCFLWFIAYATRIELITKVYAAKDINSARRSLPWAILLVILFLAYGNMYLGATARVLVWDQVTVPDQALMVLVKQYATPFMVACMLTGIAAAAMSTTDSLLLMSGAAVAHDLLRKCYHEPRGIEKDERYYLLASRLTIAAVGLIALAASFITSQMILQIVGFAVALTGSTFFAPMVAGMLLKKVSTASATAGCVGGFLVSLIHVIATLAGADWAKVIHPVVTGVGASFLLMFVVGLATSDSAEEAEAVFQK